MPYEVKNLPNLVPTSSGSSFTGGIGSLDDARSITIFVTSSATTGSSGATPLHLHVSQFDPAISAPGGVSESTGWFILGVITSSGTVTPTILATGLATTISPVSFRGIRLANLTSAALNEIIARVSKQIG